MSKSKPTIHLALVDDWELSGNGSGDVRELQFEPMRKLVDIYQTCGIHGSFNVEVMQQLSFRQNEATHPELKTLADEWDENVRETFRRGHDVQLHLHPQWLNATYAGGKWKLTGDWSILNFGMVAAAGRSHWHFRIFCRFRNRHRRAYRPFRTGGCF